MPSAADNQATAGVGVTCNDLARTPCRARPSANACSRSGPDSRVSRPMRNVSPPSTDAATSPNSRTKSTVNSSYARPRQPSVPNRGIIGAEATGSALGVLRRLARLLQPVLLGFLLARIAREHAVLLECLTCVGIEHDQCASDAQAQRAGLPAHATTVDGGIDVV